MSNEEFFFSLVFHHLEGDDSLLIFFSVKKAVASPSAELVESIAISGSSDYTVERAFRFPQNNTTHGVFCLVVNIDQISNQRAVQTIGGVVTRVDKILSEDMCNCISNQNPAGARL